MFPEYPWIVGVATIILAPVSLVSLHYSFSRPRLHQASLILLPAALVISAIGSFAAPQHTPILTEKGWYTSGGPPTGGFHHSFDVIFKADSHIDVDIQFRISGYNRRNDNSFIYQLRNSANSTVAEGEGSIWSVQLQPDGEGIAGPYHIHFNVAEGGAYTILIVSYSIDSVEPWPVVRSVPLWFDQTGPLISLFFGMGILISSALAWRSGESTPPTTGVEQKPESIQCPQCAATNPPGAKWCHLCGRHIGPNP